MPEYLFNKAENNKLFREAVKLHLEGDLSRAEEVYLCLLESEPTNAQAMHNLGAILLQQGQNDEAISFFQKAVEQQKNYPEAYNNIGNALANQGKIQDAVKFFEKAINLRPDYQIAHYNLGNTLKKAGELAESVDCYHRAIALNPHDPVYYNSLGVVLKKLGRLDKAINAYKKAVSLQINYAEAYYNMGIAYQEQGMSEKAIASYNKTIACNENYPEAYLNLGSIYEREEKFNKAITFYNRAIHYRPDYGDAYYNLGFTLEKRGDIDLAVLWQKRVLKLCPESLESIAGAAEIFIRYGYWPEAEPLIKKLLKYNFSATQTNIMSNIIFFLNAIPISPQLLFSKHLLWGNLMASKSNIKIKFRFEDHSRIRIGYVSPDFRRHSVGWFVRNIIKNHDPETVETFCYYLSNKYDEVTKEIESACTCFRRVQRKGTGDIARMISQDHINILVDLSGHTTSNRLDVFAFKPAPIQVTAIGYPNSTGLAEMDYRLTDHFADTPAAGNYYREKLVRMPGCFLPFCPLEVHHKLLRKEDLGIPDDTVILVSFNSIHKLRPEVLTLWNKILEAAPKAYLLFSFQYSHLETLRMNVLRYFNNSIKNEGRIKFLPWEDTEERHRANYGIADIALDPFPYSGTTTSYEALRMGVPVVTLVGERHVQRTTYSFLMNLGVEETIVFSEDGYLKKTVMLATDLGLLESVKEKIAAALKTSAICDVKAYVRDLERVYRLMWERYKKSLEPVEIE